MKIAPLKTIIQAIFNQHPGVIAVLLYGSHATGVATPESDVDLAVLYDYHHVPSPMTLWETKESIAEKLHCPVDLICLNVADTIIASQVLKYHEILLATDNKKLSEFFINTIVDYAELKQLRKPMEDHILERRWNARS
jgi:uncharacterized protein